MNEWIHESLAFLTIAGQLTRGTPRRTKKINILCDFDIKSVINLGPGEIQKRDTEPEPCYYPPAPNMHFARVVTYNS